MNSSTPDQTAAPAEGADPPPNVVNLLPHILRRKLLAERARLRANPFEQELKELGALRDQLGSMHADVKKYFRILFAEVFVFGIATIGILAHIQRWI